MLWIPWGIAIGGLVPVALGIYAAIVRERRLALAGIWLSAATVAAAIGGTIVGLVVAFGGVSEAPPEAKAQLLSDGIAIAMTSTRNGLVVATLGFLASIAGLVRSPRPRPEGS